LIGALQERLELVERRAGLQTHLQGDVFLTLPPALEENLYWIAQEALNNALKHAEAKQISITIHAEEGILTLKIEDNGVGFDTTSVASGIGFRTMQERAGIMGAEIELLSQPEQGTQVCVRVRVPSAID
jgi:two-component system, NarL family, sensor histidine kinase LiaS